MNTKIIMAGSAIIMWIAGIMLIFAPDEILGFLNNTPNSLSFLMQITGSLYLAFGVLNWMNRKGLIGGIYNRPVAVANLIHFLIAGIALTKFLIAVNNLPSIILVTGIIYDGFAIAFSIILLRHPLGESGKS